jgi:predicted nucleotidyltransferase
MAGAVSQESLLPEIVRRIVEAVDPDKIILFGSRARGDNRPDSDFDLLLVKESSQPKHRRAVPAYLALSGTRASVDILWRTPSEVEEWAHACNHVICRALEEGQVVYEKRT